MAKDKGSKKKKGRRAKPATAVELKAAKPCPLRCRSGGRIAPTRALFTVIPGECIKSETAWRSELNSNSRYRFVNGQTTESS
jgi:hypothetical protein